MWVCARARGCVCIFHVFLSYSYVMSVFPWRPQAATSKREIWSLKRQFFALFDSDSGEQPRSRASHLAAQSPAQPLYSPDAAIQNLSPPDGRSASQPMSVMESELWAVRSSAQPAPRHSLLAEEKQDPADDKSNVTPTGDGFMTTAPKQSSPSISFSAARPAMWWQGHDTCSESDSTDGDKSESRSWLSKPGKQ